jgi:DNA-binding beta-propeller fold protein YncE
VFAIADGRLTAIATIALEPKSRPVDIAFAEGGRSAYVVAQGTNRLLHLTVDGEQVSRLGPDLAVGNQPYSIALDPRRPKAYVTFLGGRGTATGRGPRPGSVGMVDLKAARMVDEADTGVTPEHVGLSPDGRFIAVTVNNGSSAPAGSPIFHDYGLLTIYRTDGGKLAPVAEAHTGHWCQGAIWTSNQKRLLLQCAREKHVEIYDFDGHALAVAGEAPIALDGRPASIATARSR